MMSPISKSFLEAEEKENLQRMSHMVRYNNEIHFHSENVAEHSFYVAIYAISICDYLGITGTLRSQIVERAITHDVSEIELSDIPHDVKYGISGLAKYCTQFEIDFNEKHFPNSYEHLEKGCSKLVNYVVELADIMSVRQYSQQEVDLGNRKKFYQIFLDTDNRIADVIERLKSLDTGLNFDGLMKLIL